MKNLILLKHTAAVSFIGATVLSTSFTTKALTVEEVINPRQDNGGWVTDMADILSYRTETELNNLITNSEKSNRTEIAVVTVPETTPADSPKTFATTLFNYWGIGKAESDNGVLFLVSLGDNRVEIETGYGIEDILTDAEVAKIIDTKITPQYKHGNLDRGTLDGTEALISSLQPSANTQDGLESAFNTSNEIKASPPNIQTSSFAGIFIIVCVVWGIVLILSNISSDRNTSNGRKRKRSKSSSNNYYSGCDSSSSGSSFFSSGSSGSGDFSSGSSSSSDFGGGSSDGGGAGGDF